MEKYTFKLINSKNISQLESILKSEELQNYWVQNPEIKEDFAKVEKGNSSWEYWVGEGTKPQCLLIRRALEWQEDEKLSPWLEEGKSGYWIDFVPLSQEPLSHLIEQFLELSDPSGAFLTDPEVQQEEKVVFWEQIGFKRVGSLIKGQGFFKGTSHHVLKRFR